MNSILYNFSLVLLLSGIIILTMSLTKSHYKNEIINKVNKKYINNINEDEEEGNNDSEELIYNPSQVFSDVFNYASPWMGFTKIKQNKEKIDENIDDDIDDNIDIDDENN